MSKSQRDLLAKRLDLPWKQVKIWFQNRRIKQKRETGQKVEKPGNNKGAITPSQDINGPYPTDQQFRGPIYPIVPAYTIHEAREQNIVIPDDPANDNANANPNANANANEDIDLDNIDLNSSFSSVLFGDNKTSIDSVNLIDMVTEDWSLFENNNDQSRVENTTFINL